MPLFVPLRTSSPLGITLCAASMFAAAHVPAFPPDKPALILQLETPALAARVKTILGAVYPHSHEVRLIRAGGGQEDGREPETLTLDELDEPRQYTAATALLIPPMATGSSLESMQEVVAHLRAPEGCPWDREQTARLSAPPSVGGVIRGHFCLGLR